MKVEQIYTLMNTVTNEVLGTTDLVTEDLSNVVDIGTEIFNANAVDAYVRSLTNHIGRVIFVDRVYRGNVPAMLRDGWEFGSVLEKIQAEMPEAVENSSWDLEDNTEYSPFVFHKPTVSATFYNDRVTFEVELSYTSLQVKQSFSSIEQLNGFLSMMFNAVENSMTVKMDSLIQRTLNTGIALTVKDDYGNAALSSKSGIKAVNLLYLYNNKFNTSLTASDAITNPDFIRYAVYTIGLYQDRLTKINSLFNIDGKARFTPKDLQHVVLLSEFARSADAYLNSDVYHNELVKLPTADIVPYFQAPGQDYSFANTSKISVVTPDNNTVEVTGILGVLFDHDAMGCANLDRRTQSVFNPKAEFFNNFYKFDAGYFLSKCEQIVVFFVA